MAKNSTPVDKFCGVSSWHSFHIYLVKLIYAKKKYSAEQIKAYSLLIINQPSKQPVINNASF